MQFFEIEYEVGHSPMIHIFNIKALNEPQAVSWLRAQSNGLTIKTVKAITQDKLEFADATGFSWDVNPSGRAGNSQWGW